MVARLDSGDGGVIRNIGSLVTGFEDVL
jgi:hypothetical protein